MLNSTFFFRPSKVVSTYGLCRNKLVKGCNVSRGTNTTAAQIDFGKKELFESLQSAASEFLIFKRSPNYPPHCILLMLKFSAASISRNLFDQSSYESCSFRSGPKHIPFRAYLDIGSKVLESW